MRAALVSLVSTALLLGCGGPGGPADGGVGCPDASTELVVNANVGQLQWVADSLYFLDYGQQSVRAIAADGGTPRAVYPAAATHTLNDYRVDGDTAYVLESEKLPSGAEITAIWAVPVGAGAPRLVVNHSDPRNGPGFDRLDRIVGIDSAALYVIRAITGAVLFRVDKASGAETVVSVGPFASRPQLVGSDFFFPTGEFPISGHSGTYGLGKVPTSAIEATPVRHGTGACDGELLAGAFGFLCTGALEATAPANRAVSFYDSTGGAHREVWRNPESSNPRVGATDGTFAYLASDKSTTGSTPIVQVAIADGSEKTVVCGRRTIRRQGAHEGGGIHSALVAGYDMAMSATDLFWIETYEGTSGPVTSIFRAPRPR